STATWSRPRAGRHLPPSCAIASRCSAPRSSTRHHSGTLAPHDVKANSPVMPGMFFLPCNTEGQNEETGAGEVAPVLSSVRHSAVTNRPCGLLRPHEAAEASACVTQADTAGSVEKDDLLGVPGEADFFVDR